MKIAIIGTHGTGKTTLAYRLCAEAKKRAYNAVILNETARSCPFPINQGSSLDGFLWMTGTQIAKEQAAKAHKSDYIVCDRSVLDHVCYVPYDLANGEIYDYFKLALGTWMTTYDKIFWVHPTGEAIIPDGIRATDMNYQMKIHERFREIFDNIPILKNIKVVFSRDIFDDHLDEVIKEAFRRD